MQRDRVERAVEPRRLDVQRDPPQRLVVIVAPDHGVAHLQVAGSPRHLAPCGESGGYEAFHQEAIAGLQIGFAGRDAPAAKMIPRRHQIALAPEIERIDGRALQGREIERPPPARHACDHVVPRHRFPFHEADRLFPIEHDAQRSMLRRGPERELQSIGGVPPVAGQKERAEGVHRLRSRIFSIQPRGRLCDLHERLDRRELIVLWPVERSPPDGACGSGTYPCRLGEPLDSLLQLVLAGSLRPIA